MFLFALHYTLPLIQYLTIIPLVTSVGGEEITTQGDYKRGIEWVTFVSVVVVFLSKTYQRCTSALVQEGAPCGYSELLHNGFIKHAHMDLLLTSFHN